MKTLPLDILLYIIDLLACGDNEDIKSLKILSQTCKSMVPLCRKHFFSSLFLHSELYSERFSDLLSKNPDIACYVTRLFYSVYIPVSDHELNILDMLKGHSSLQSIILSSSGLDWNNLNESIRSSLVSLIQLPTITHLYTNFKGFPETVLSGCSNLIDLELGKFKLAPPEVNQVISRTKIPTPVSLHIYGTAHDDLKALLNSATLHAGDPIVDFSRLQKAYFLLESQDSFFLVNGLIKVITRLEYLEIHVDYKYVGLAGLGESLAINAYRTLESLKLNIPIRRDSYEPLCGLSCELRFIARKNILESLELFMMVEDDASFQILAEEPSAFDSMLSESGAFPVLHRVSVAISWYSESMDLGGMKVAMESLRKDKFPRLIESKAVKFNFDSNLKLYYR